MGVDKRRFREARFPGLFSTMDALLDRRFTEWLPIWILVIEHPEGIFLIDTGECSEAAMPDYFRPAGWLASRYITTQFRFSIRREDVIDRQLAQLGISIPDIRSVILTHLHFDHTDGLKYFPSTPIFVHRLEWERPYGALPALFPSWFAPRLLTLNTSCGPFEKAFYLTSSRDLALVHTPGHTHGHCSVLLKADQCHVLFAGDICYTQDQLIHGKFAARAAAMAAARQTYATVKAYARLHPLVFLPSHDAESGTRLRQLNHLPVLAYLG
jgi:N-acyl homoserine lactone hydrolase